MQQFLEPQKKESGFQGLLSVLGPILIGLNTAVNGDKGQAELFAKQKAMRRETQAKARLDQFARSVIKDDSEWTAYQADPKGWAGKVLGNKYDFHSVGQGDTGFWGNPDMEGSTSRTAPKVFEVGPDLIQADPSGVLSRAPMLPGAGGGESYAPRPPATPSSPDGLPTITNPDEMRNLPPGAFFHNADGSIGVVPDTANDAPFSMPMLGDAPSTTSVIHKGKSEMERYAEQFGAPGSKEWKEAIQDWRLRGSGPTAYVYKDLLQDDRLTQSDTNNLRTTGTSAANNQRTTGTSRDNNIRTTTTSQGNNERTNQTRRDTARGGFRSGGPTEGQRITNPKTGQVAVMRGGKWVDVKTGQPIAGR